MSAILRASSRSFFFEAAVYPLLHHGRSSG
jgi:hypothetical protein